MFTLLYNTVDLTTFTMTNKSILYLMHFVFLVSAFIFLLVSLLSLLSKTDSMTAGQREVLGMVQRLAVVLAVERYMVWPLSR